MSSNKPILFYSQAKSYGEFSNFYPCTVTIYGIAWKTSEHAFQAMKYTDRNPKDEPCTLNLLKGSEEQFHKVVAAATPAQAAKYGRDRSVKIRSDWEDVKDDIMYEIVLVKFLQNRGPQRVLLSTNGSPLVEHTTNDSYWADGGDGSGKNMLGIILCKVRKTITELVVSAKSSSVEFE